MSTATRAGAGTATKVAGFAAVLAVVFGGAWAVGAQVGPIGTTVEADTATDSSGHSTGHGAGVDIHRSEQPDQAEQQEDDMSNTTNTRSAMLPGLAIARDGYRLVLADTTPAPGSGEVAFTIEGPDAQPVTKFDVEHEKRLHLILVRRDHAGFQHLHPTLDETTGTWTAQAQLTPGAWRVFADFTAADGPALVLGADLLVPGQVPAPAAAKETRNAVVDGYTVTVDGTLAPGEHSALTLTVSMDGAPVTDLQPYLGAYGHLVALREGDLAYLHVHPGGEPGDGRTESGPEIEFGAEVPSTGRYHLYLDFQHDGVVRTAHLILDAGRVVSSHTEPSSDSGHGETDHTH